MRFLIVDDSLAIQAIVRRAIEKLGIQDMEYKVAQDGIAALKIMDSWRPDMVLTDWHMPGMSGIELLKAIRSRNWDDINVGFITTETAKDNVDKAKRLGARFFVNKPFKDEELAALVRDVLSDARSATQDVTTAVTVASENKVADLFETLFQRKISVVALPNENADEIHLPSAVGLYAHARTGEIRALCLLDYKAIVMVGGTGLGKSLPEVSKLYENKEVAKDVWDYTLGLVEEHISGLFTSSDGTRLRLIKTQLLKHKPDQLREIMKRSPCRRDFALARAKLPQGQLTLISK